MAQISNRAMSSITDYQTSIPDIFDNVYDAETNPSGVISLALSENVREFPNLSVNVRLFSCHVADHFPYGKKHLIHGPLTEFINKNVRHRQSKTLGSTR